MKRYLPSIFAGALLLCTVFAFAAEDPAPRRGASHIVQAATTKQQDDPGTTFDRILSGEEALPVVSGDELKEKFTGNWDQTMRWFHKQREALLVFLIGSAASIAIGAALAFAIRITISHREEDSGKFHWQFFSAIANPLILMAISAAVFLFLLPVLHSLPELYPLDARLFFTWLTLLAAWAGFQLISVFNIRLHAYAKRANNNLDALMVDILRKLLKIVLICVTIFFIGQSIFDLNITTLLAGAGVVGLAVAFASRETLSNFFGTLVIILDRPFRIGDRIQIGDINGLVRSVGMRSTRVLTGNESEFTIPNSRIAETPVENISNRGVIRYAFSIGLVYGTTGDQLEQAMKLLHEIADNFKGPDQQQYRPRIFFETLGASALNIKVIMWLKTTTFETEEKYRTEINLAIIRKFTDAKLDMAFNSMTNYLAGSVQLLPPEAPKEAK